MRQSQVLLVALALVACDGANEQEGGAHGGGHDGSMQVLMGRGPGPASAAHHAESAPDHAADHAAPDHAADHAAPDHATPEPAAPEAPTDAAADEPAADAPPTDEPAADAPPAEEPAADAPPADAPAAEPPPPAGDAKSEAEWAKLAKVKLGSAKVDGALDPNVVRDATRSNLSDLRQCYAQGLAKAPALTGKLTVEFVIDKKGKVESTQVKSSTLGDAAVESCVTAAIGGWKFDPPDDGKSVKVKYPFTLSL